MKRQHRSKAKPKQEPDTKERNELGLSFRAVGITATRAEGSDEIRVSLSVSSAEPVLSYVFFNDNYQRVYEILDHSENSIKRDRMQGGLVIQDTHYGDQIGLIREPKIVDGKLGGEVEFCTGERAQEIAKDAEKELRTNSSVGYIVDASSYVLEGERDGIPVVRAMSWTPYEASFVNVPADTSVGVGRELNKQTPDNQERKKERNIMNPKEMAALFTRAAKFGIETSLVEAINMEDAGAARAALDALIVDKQAKDVEDRDATIVTLNERKPAMPDAKKRTGVDLLGGDVETEKQIIREYSVLNVARRAAGISADCGFEDEVSRYCIKNGMGSKRGGQFVLPHAVIAGKRDFSVSGTSGATVATNLLVNEFVPYLRTNSIMGMLGMRFLTGLTGDVDISKQTAAAAGYWVGEGGDITDGAPELGTISGTPHTAGVRVPITRRMLLQSTPGAEELVRADIMEVLIRTLQIATFQGTGANGQPSAITSASGINNPSVTQGTPTFLELLDFIGNIISDNAAANGQKWAMTGEVWTKLAGTFIDASSNAERVLNLTNETVLGKPYHVTEDVGANSLFFGNWNTVMLGIWGGGVDLNLDTSTKSASGGVILTGLQDADVMVRNGEALSYNNAVTSD